MMTIDILFPLYFLVVNIRQSFELGLGMLNQRLNDSFAIQQVHVVGISSATFANLLRGITSQRQLTRRKVRTLKGGGGRRQKAGSIKQVRSLNAVLFVSQHLQAVVQ